MDDLLSAECYGGCACRAERLCDNTKAITFEDSVAVEVMSE